MILGFHMEEAEVKVPQTLDPDLRSISGGYIFGIGEFIRLLLSCYLNSVKQ